MMQLAENEEKRSSGMQAEATTPEAHQCSAPQSGASRHSQGSWACGAASEAKAGTHGRSWLLLEAPMSLQGSRSGVPGALFRCCVASWLNRAVCCPCRYSALARTAKRILEKYNAQPLGVNARYACAYSTIEKRDW